MNAMEISLSGLDVEWRRMEICALNLANLGSTRAADGRPYVPLRLVSGPAESFGSLLEANLQPQGLQPRGVRVQAIEGARGTHQAYEPGHPDADAAGFVTYPDISQAEEMTLLLKSSRAYEANLVALAAAQQIYSSALQIGRQS